MQRTPKLKMIPLILKKIDDPASKAKTVGIGIWTVLDDVGPAWVIHTKETPRCMKIIHTEV